MILLANASSSVADALVPFDDEQFYGDIIVEEHSGDVHESDYETADVDSNMDVFERYE